MAKKSKFLEELGEAFKNIKVENVNDLDIDALKEIKIHMRDLTDYRGDISYQPLENIVLIVFIALMANCNEWTEIYQFGVIHKDWFSRFLDLKYGIPSISTIRKTMAIIDPAELEEQCVNIITKKIDEMVQLFQKNGEKQTEKNKDIISFDGKVCSSSSRKNSKTGKQKPVNAMSAFNVTKDMCLATKFIDEKTNEIPTGPELIKMLDLTNTISTFDALNTQEKTIKAIVEKGGNYVAPIKENQKTLYNDIKDYFDDKILFEEAIKESYYEETEKSHNQTEKRTYIMTSKIDWLPNKEKWENIKSIGFVMREYEKDNEKITDIRYYITDLNSTEISNFKKAVRGEWGIENNLHWHLDYTFREDANLTMNKNAQSNLNILRKLCLNILKLIKPLYNKSLKMIRFILGQDFENEISRVIFCLNIEEIKRITKNTQ